MSWGIDNLRPIIEREVDAGKGPHLLTVAHLWAGSYPSSPCITAESIKAIIQDRLTRLQPDARCVDDELEGGGK